MKQFIMLVAYLLTVAIVLLTVSCKSAPASPESAVRAMCAAEAMLPAGQIYHSDAPEGSPEYLPPELLASAYGIPKDYAGIEKAAVRLSGNGHPSEFAVFLCKDANTAEDVALFCRNRIASLALNSSFSSKLAEMSKEEYDGYLSSATVAISGRYVAFIISSDVPTAKKAFLKAI